MAVSQKKSRRSKSGARSIPSRKKRQNELGGNPTFTKLGPRRVMVKRGMGGNCREILLAAQEAMITDQLSNTVKRVQIKNIVENPANRNFIRRNIITKGCVVDTDLGKARVTNRPGQMGIVQAVLIK